MAHLSYPASLFVLIYWIPLFCDWLFCLYHGIIYICYFVASDLFSLWQCQFLWSCCVLLYEETQSLSLGFPLLTMSKFSLVRFCLFVAWNIHKVVFLSIVVFLFIFLPLMLVLSVLFLVAVITFPPCILYGLLVSMHWRYLEYWQFISFFIFLIHVVSQRHLWNERPNASSWVFLSSGPFVEVFLSFTLRMVPSSLRGGDQVFFSLMKFLLCCLVSSCFSFSWDILFKLFLSSLLD